MEQVCDLTDEEIEKLKKFSAKYHLQTIHDVIDMYNQICIYEENKAELCMN